MEALCGLCPHQCRLKEGGLGFCGARQNQGGRIVDRYYGLLSALALDPIEKKPLRHYYPGQFILSAGFYGCNFRCPFCQNHGISQLAGRGEPPSGLPLSPEELCEKAVEQGSFGIAYTYSEPLIHYEYLLDCAREARRRGLKNVLVTNGCLTQGPAEKLLPWIDAANVDLKSFNPDFYREELKGDLETVKNFIRLAWDKIHLEVTTLIIPGKNDGADEVFRLSGFLASLSPRIPLHLSAYFPRYHYTLPPTSRQSLFRLTREARKNLAFVHPGNI
ncbi:MAG: AmmeMemoRadiSam system radical SAM enzyme [Spirochaetales bacterium]|jgi:pyruvate formate lyase activating enzyme|nr:AmmeMemoRadiSam system radical SAM enzyme [Spirochaetales bacterium]